MSEIEHNHKLDEILSNTNFDKLNNMYSPMNEQHDVSEELLGVTSVSSDDATGTMEIARRGGRCGNTCVGLDLCIFPHPGICLRPGVYCINTPVYPPRVIETVRRFSKMACIQENMVHMHKRLLQVCW